MYRLIADYESEDGYISRGVIVDEFETKKEATECIKEHIKSFTSGYSNFSIYDIEEEL